MKPKCDFCEPRQRGAVLYEDVDVIAMVKDTAVQPGQVTVFPREHYPILELVPDLILAKCAVLANKVGIAVFDGLDAAGTNIIIQNGVAGGQKIPHFSIDVIPRRDNDGLSFQWPTKQVSEEEMDTIFLTLQEGAKTMVAGKETISTKKEILPEKPDRNAEKKKNVDNYLLKAVKRLP